MKKTIVALSIAGLFAGSAQAWTFYENQDAGTKLEFLGSARVKWESTSNKTENYAAGTVTKEHENQAVRNNGSRFGFRVNQQLGAGFYATGRVEWRFRGTAPSQHDFDDIYTRQLYAGIGHKKYGELLYGNLTTITDEVKQTDLANTYSISDGLLNFMARRAVQYTYSGIEGLKVGGFYGRTNYKGNDGTTLSNPRKDVWGAAAIYKFNISDKEKATIAGGITRERSYVTGGLSEATAYALGSAYTYGNTTVGLDLERRATENKATSDKKTQREVRTVLYHRITKDWRAYTQYGYKNTKVESFLGDNTRQKRHQFMFGSEYYFISDAPVQLKGFAEWQADWKRNETNGVKTSKVRDYKTVLGLRLYW